MLTSYEIYRAIDMQEAAAYWYERARRAVNSPYSDAYDALEFQEMGEFSARLARSYMNLEEESSNA